MTIKILFRNFVFTDWLHKNMIGFKNLWMHFSVLILVGGHGALQERLGVIGDGLPTLGEDVLDPGDGGERGPGHGLEDGAEGGPGVEPVHLLAPLLEVHQHRLEALGCCEVSVDDVVAVYHNRYLSTSLISVLKVR